MSSPPPPTVWPSLHARDARGLIRFLLDAFGFEQTVVYGEGDRVDHAELAWPLGGGVMLGSGSSDGGTLSCYVVTDDADALYARAKAAGAEVLRELGDTDYGSRDCAFRDPEGNRWSFGTYAGHPRG